MTRPHRVQARFRDVAERVDGQYVEFRVGNVPAPAVVAVTARHRYTLVRPPQAALSVPMLLVPFVNHREVRIHIRPERWPIRILKRLGFIQEVVTGDATLDARFLLTASPRAALREILESERARAYLGGAGSITLRTSSRMEVTFGSALDAASLPEGVALLLLRASWGLPPADRLAALFGLAREVIQVLDPSDGEGGAQDRRTLLDRLRRPAPLVHLPGTDLPLWDVREDQREAARTLGQMGGEGVLEALLEALEDGGWGLVPAAVDGLASLGDENAVGPLAGLLGRRATGPGDSEASHAERALRVLGRSGLVDAFTAAVQGDPERLRGLGLAGAERDGVVSALLEILQEGPLVSRPYAARALGVLGAQTALPALRRASRAAGMKTALTRAAGAAIQAIEARASLPRRARPGPAPGPDTLPRPAEPPGPRGDLPRPASPHGEG